MLVHDWCWLPGRKPDGLEDLLLREEPGMYCHWLRRKHEEERRQRAALEDACVHWEGIGVLAVEGDARCRAGVQEVHPALRSGPNADCCYALSRRSYKYTRLCTAISVCRMRNLSVALLWKT